MRAQVRFTGHLSSCGKQEVSFFLASQPVRWQRAVPSIVASTTILTQTLFVPHRRFRMVPISETQAAGLCAARTNVTLTSQSQKIPRSDSEKRLTCSFVPNSSTYLTRLNSEILDCSYHSEILVRLVTL